jgi:hypothetical protein
MVHLFARHPVADYTTWRKVYDDFEAERRRLGVTADAVYQSVDDPNDITVRHDFATREAAESFAASPRLQEVMQQAGVRGMPEIWFVTDASGGSA